MELIYDELLFQHHVVTQSKSNTLGTFEFLHPRSYYAGTTRYSNMCDFRIARKGKGGHRDNRPAGAVQDSRKRAPNALYCRDPGKRTLRPQQCCAWGTRALYPSIPHEPPSSSRTSLVRTNYRLSPSCLSLTRTLPPPHRRPTSS